MTHDPASRATRRLPRIAKWAGISLLVLALALLVLYLTAPVLVAALSPYVAEKFGLTSLELAIDRPGRRGMSVHSFVAVREDVEVRGRDAHLDYSWTQLRRGRIDRIAIASVDVVLRQSKTAQTTDDNAGDDRVMPALPVESLSIDTLTLELPETGFVGSGHATLDGQGLSLSLAGQAPEAASRLFVTATLSADGVFVARLGEQDSIDPPFLTLRGDIAGDALAMTGDVRLAGYPLTLACAIAGVPDGSGEVTGAFSVHLPRPLPDDFSWRQLETTVDAFAIDWRSADGAIAIDGVAGSANLDAGEIDLRLGGTASLRADGSETTLTLRDDYRLHFQADTFAGADGLRLTYTNGETRATLTSRSLRVTPGTTTGFVFEGNLEAQDKSFTARGSLGGDLSASREPALHGAAHFRFAGSLGRKKGPQPRTRDIDVAASANLSPEGAYEVKLSLPDAEQPFLSLRGTQSDDELVLDAQTTLSGAALELVSVLAGVPAGRGQLTATAGTRLRLPPADPFTWGDLDISVPTLTADWSSDDKTYTLRDITGSAQLRAGRLDTTLAGTLVQQEDGRTITARVPPNYSLAFEQGRLSGAAGVRIDYKDADNSATAALRSFSFERAARSQLNADADIDARVGNVHATGRLNARATVSGKSSGRDNGRIAFDGGVTVKQRRYDGKLAATFTVTKSEATMRGKVSTFLANEMPFEVRYQRATGAGSFHATHTFDIDNGAAALFIPDWQNNYDLDRGRVDATFDLQWAALDKIGARLSLDLNDAQAHYDAYRAVGVDGRLLLQADDVADGASWRLTPSTLTIAGVDVGLPIRDVSLGLSWSGDRVDFTQLAASLLGGRATAAPFSYDIEAGAAAVDLELNGIDLARVLALEGDDITGTGTLDGTLPLTISDNQPRVSAGTMQARPPGGLIRVSPKLSGTTALANLSFALNALADYRYHTLTTDIDYAANGDLKLGVHLQGRNPEIEQGRPIHYNLTISENVPVLLESLRLQDTFTEQIENKVKN